MSTDISSTGSVQAERNARALATDHLMADLGRRTAQGSFIAIGAQGVRMVLQLSTAVVMARLLSPADFGLVAMAATVTGFVGLFTDLGLSAATVQRDDIDQETISALFYINVAVGLLVMLAAFAASPVAAWFFNDDRVLWLIVAQALAIPLSAATAQHNALLQRGMRWMTMQWTGIATQFLGSAIGILLAWQTDWGYWSLVAQTWVGAVAGLALVWLVIPWRPSRVKSWCNIRSALNFGLNLTGFNFVNYFHRQFDNVLIGWYWGAGELGFYTRAYILLTMPLSLINGPIGSAVMPALSRMQNDPERWRNAILEALGFITLISFGFVAILIIAAEPLVLLLLGPTWSETATIFQYLAISMFAATLMNPMGWIYISLGQTERMLRWSLYVTPVIVASFTLGIPWAAKGVALSYSIVMCLAFVPCVAYATKGTPLRTREVLRIAAPLLLASMVTIAIGLRTSLWSINTTSSKVVDLVGTIAISLTTYAICVVAIFICDPTFSSLRRRVTKFKLFA